MEREELSDALIRELTTQTPYARLRLKAAWDSLSAENQMKILLVLEEQGLPAESIIRKALESKNSYIRYLAARNVNTEPPESDKESIALLQKIRNDKDPLVVSALHQIFRVPGKAVFDVDKKNIDLKDDKLLDSTETIYNLDIDVKTDEDELARISVPKDITPYSLSLHLLYHTQMIRERAEKGGNDSTVIRLLNQLIYTLLQCDIVRLQHLNICEGKDADLSPLWGLATVLPERLTFPIISNAPITVSGINKIEKNVVLNLLPRQLLILLNRKDFHFPSVRKEIFFSEIAEKHYEIRKEAAQFYMPLSYEELKDVFDDPGPGINKVMALADSTYLELCMIEAINDHIKRYGDKDMLEKDPRFVFEMRNPDKEMELKNPTRTFSEHYANLKTSDMQKTEAINLSLYRLAKAQSEDIEAYLPNELQFLKPLIVLGRPWVTFIHFHDAIYPKESLPNSEAVDASLVIDDMKSFKQEIERIGSVVTTQNHRFIMQALKRIADILKIIYDRQENLKTISREQRKLMSFSRKIKYVSIGFSIVIALIVLVHWTIHG